MMKISGVYIMKNIAAEFTRVGAYETSGEYADAARAGIRCTDDMIEAGELESAYSMVSRTKKNIGKALEKGQIDIETAEGLGREITIAGIAIENGFRIRGRGLIGP